mgnify:CR=1 FL=1
MKQGHYFGTEIGGKWWRRYRESGFFARGSGEFDIDAAGIHFRRKLSKAALLIGWDEIKAARTGKSHAGQWGVRRPVLKVDFARDDLELCAGFTLSRDWDETEKLAADINARGADMG